jgi:hypothetical protein
MDTHGRLSRTGRPAHRYVREVSGRAECREEMIMAKLPKAPHPLPQLTSTELLKYIEELRQALRTDLSDSDREQVLARLGPSYAEANERGLTVPGAAEVPEARLIADPLDMRRRS